MHWLHILHLKWLIPIVLGSVCVVGGGVAVAVNLPHRPAPPAAATGTGDPADSTPDARVGATSSATAAPAGDTPTPSDTPSGADPNPPQDGGTGAGTGAGAGTGSGSGGSGVSAPPAGNAAPPDAPAISTEPSVGKGWALSSSKVGLAPFGLRCSDLPELTAKWPGNTVPAGTVISRVRITGWLDLSMGNITIKQSCIQPKSGAVGMGSTSLSTWSSVRELQGPIVIEDSEYDGSLLSAKEQAYIGFFQGVASMYRNYIHNSGSGIGLQGTDERTGANVVIQNNYVDNLIAYGDPSGSGNHQSGFTVRDFTGSGRQLLVKDNYFDCDGANATGAFFVQPNGGEVRNLTIQGNYLGGMGYNLILEDDQGRFPGVTYHNVRAIDNRFSPKEYGPVLVSGSGEGWAAWSSNYLYSAGGTDGQGATVRG